MAASIDKVEGFAELFHHYYTALASDFECEARESPEWRELLPKERRRFVAATRLALLEAGSAGLHNDGQAPSASHNAGSEGRECGC